ncbi:unnamed protein product [marine sediment metagenome]|uniref:Hydrogenase expression/formation protein HypE n=1 Tax=marine sediment metagenome TaxID=412755 RepID=X1VIG7_9ZZZZ
MKTNRHDRILLAHGGGGQLTDELIRHHILPKLKNDTLAELGDSAKLNVDSKSLCFTTDSYVVKPLFFNGGDIGKLAMSSTEIRDRLAAGRDVTNMLHPPVANYIRKHNLYQSKIKP